MLKVNVEELCRLAGVTGAIPAASCATQRRRTVVAAVRQVLAGPHAPAWVAITDGPHRAYLFPGRPATVAASRKQLQVRTMGQGGDAHARLMLPTPTLQTWPWESYPDVNAVEGYWEYDVPAVPDVKNPVGAGDSVAAATLSAALAGVPIHAAFALGLAVGSDSCRYCTQRGSGSDSAALCVAHHVPKNALASHFCWGVQV